MNLTFNNPSDAFSTLYGLIMLGGQERGNTKAFYNVSFTLNEPLERVITTEWRKFSTSYAEAEYKWYLNGDRDATEISKRAPLWRDMMIPGTTEVNSNYGYYWNYNYQLQNAVEELRLHPDSRRSIVVHYDLNELDRYKHDTPCNVVLNFFIEHNSLHLTIFARSIDLVYGFCNDQYIFSKLMESVAESLGLPVGSMHWFITNLHVYEKHFKMAE